jgi:hypothetical protein
VIDRLVTPLGTKILYPAADLARIAGVAEADMEVILQQLASGPNRIIREVA